MLKAKINKSKPGAKVIVDADGTIEELTDDICNVVNAIHSDINRIDSASADVFKEALQELFADDGPVWMSPEELEEG